MLIRIGEQTIYNTETGNLIQMTPEGTLFLDGWDEANKANPVLHDEDAATAWMALTNAASYQEDRLMGNL
jgi:hypothetical protein